MTRRAAGAALLLLVPLLATSGCGSSSPSPSSSPTPTSDASSGVLTSERCADLVVLGVRGSGQAADLNRGVGKEVLRTVTALAGLVEARTGDTVRLEAVPYDASGVATTAAFFDHVRAGARLVADQADAVVDQCPDSRLAVVGFSQGAQVTHAFADDVDTSLARRIVLVGMIADPSRNPSDDIVHWSYADQPVPRPGLLGAGRPIDADVRADAISFCHDADEVCNARGIRGEKTSAAHRFFYERAATVTITATQLDAVLQRRGL